MKTLENIKLINADGYWLTIESSLGPAAINLNAMQCGPIVKRNFLKWAEDQLGAASSESPSSSGKGEDGEGR